MTHICISDQGHRLIRWWLVACSAPSHYLDHCLHFANLIFQWNVRCHSNYNYFHSRKCICKCRLQNTDYHDDVIKWNIFRVTGHWCGEFTGHRWILHTKASDASFGVFFDLRLNKRLSKQSWGWWSKTPSNSLWRHVNVLSRPQYAHLSLDRVSGYPADYNLVTIFVKHNIRILPEF